MRRNIKYARCAFLSVARHAVEWVLRREWGGWTATAPGVGLKGLGKELDEALSELDRKLTPYGLTVFGPLKPPRRTWRKTISHAGLWICPTSAM
jgi:hypothetical protein